jgi:hypothetical protein
VGVTLSGISMNKNSAFSSSGYTTSVASYGKSHATHTYPNDASSSISAVFCERSRRVGPSAYWCDCETSQY